MKKKHNSSSQPKDPRDLECQYKKYKDNQMLEQQHQLDTHNPNQQFYRLLARQGHEQIMVKHGYKLFAIQSEEEDLAMFCLGLLDYEVKLPLKLIYIDKVRQETEDLQKYKEAWVETQFVHSTHSESKLQKTIYNFMIHRFCPPIQQFKKAKITWQHMATSQYTDIAVITDFQQLVKSINNQFDKLLS